MTRPDSLISLRFGHIQMRQQRAAMAHEGIQPSHGTKSGLRCLVSRSWLLDTPAPIGHSPHGSAFAPQPLIAGVSRIAPNIGNRRPGCLPRPGSPRKGKNGDRAEHSENASAAGSARPSGVRPGKARVPTLEDGEETGGSAIARAPTFSHFARSLTAGLDGPLSGRGRPATSREHEYG